MNITNKSSIFSLDFLKAQLINWRRSFTLIWKASPYHTTVWAILLVLQGILPGLMVYLTKLVVDSLTVAISSQGDWEKIRPAVFYISFVALTMLMSEIIQSLLEIVRSDQADIIQDYVTKLVHDKSATLDMAYFDSPEYHDRLEQATSGTSTPLSLLESLGSLVQNSITLLVMTTLIVQYSLWLPLVLFISTLPAFIIILWFDRKYLRWWQSTTSTRRWIRYFDSMLTLSLAAAEVKLFNLNPHFQKSYQTLRKDLRTQKISQMRKLGIAKLFSAVFSMLLLGCAIFWVGLKALYGTFTLGDIALFYQAFDRSQTLMRTLLSNIGQMIKNSLYLGVLFEFLDLNSNVTDPITPAPLPEKLKVGIKIKNITFRYPGTEKPIFNNFSMFIPAGSTVAIVGENGSGKTTLIKLLCRFYDPEEGSIEFDRVDIRKFNVKNFHKLISIMFQVPLSFHATVRETIALGDLDKNVTDEEIEKAAQSAGAHEFISRFPDKYNTLLGKAYAKGVELSGGEWQRMALARAYIRESSPLVLLDEPTSFLDSWAEAHWFRLFKKLTENRTAVVITHRFTIAMRADYIFVMNKGKIVESGTHQSLLESDGLYAQSWKEQMQAVKVAESNNKTDNFFDVIEEDSNIHQNRQYENGY